MLEKYSWGKAKFLRSDDRNVSPMLLYEVKLIHRETQEVLFVSLEKVPVFPPPELSEKYLGALLVITTRDHAVRDVNKTSA